LSGARWRWPVAIGLIGLGLFVYLVAASSPWSGRPFAIGGYRLDLDVYRIGSLVWQHGGELYGPLPPTVYHQHMPFTYPPLSAIVFAPLSRVPFWVASVGINLLTAVSVLVVLVLALRRLGRPRARWARWLVIAALFPMAMWFEPIRETLKFGQINAVLMVLVAIDCLIVRRGWPRGILVGIAAALKLTPAAFILWFLIRRDWRGALRSLVSFGVVTGIAFVLDPHDSLRYWSSTVFNTGRIGDAAFFDNQSITGVLARFGLTGAPRELLWLTLAAGVLALAALGMRRALAAGQPVLALSVNAVAVLLCSPVSWSHHWVWAVPLVLSLGALGVRSRSVPIIAATAVSLVVFLLPSLLVWDVYLGVGLLATVAFVPLRRPIGWAALTRFLRRPPLEHAEYLTMRRLAGLDGLRAIAALVVVFFHNQGPDILQGWIGVQIFFVLSGYLITTLLLREHSATGRVDLGRFYLRRAFRILPVYLLVLGLIAAGLLAAGTFGSNPLGRQFPLYLVFGNEFTLGGPYGQSWTLGIEQKFYLVWPVLAFTTIIVGRGAVTAKRAALTSGLLVLALAAIPFTLGSDPKGWPVNYVSILLGCVVALLMHDKRGYRVLRPLTRPWVAGLVGIGFVVVHLSMRPIRDLLGHQHLVPNLPSFVSMVPVYALAVAILLPAVVAPGPVSWLLSRRPMVFLGERSYSLYLLQNLAQGLVLLLVPTLTGLGRAIPVAAVAVLFAHVCHRWVERPLIERGRRVVANRRARSTPDPVAYSERVDAVRAK
jgi:peptidoglycan/LPS O-acetylase OafA/YrhL